MLIYPQSTGAWANEDGTALLDANGDAVIGWSGNHDGRNNGDMDDKPCLGPLPKGEYTICPWEDHHDHLGPMVAFLKPDIDNVMHGRGDFFIHGPGGADPANCSKGCTVVPQVGRAAIKDSGETRVRVVA